MAKLASVFFLISDSLLWPVMIGLLLGLALAVWRFGKTLRISIERRRESKVVKQVTDALEKKQIKEAEELLRSSAFSSRACYFLATLLFLLQSRNDSALLDKALADAQHQRFERAKLLRILMKFGPAFGLMGTLIPLGPALVGLATGDLEALAQNLGIAFATTVVGLAVSSLAFFSSVFEKSWDIRDSILCAFAADRIL
ncbi:MAG: MotA/TolQ/ExbB proton channel family protein [Thermoguttaceae bacterium]|nr:MotA/TolQ/ExbB proton channel family protein [Thermoguttaceae bacterium]